MLEKIVGAQMAKLVSQFEFDLSAQSLLCQLLDLPKNMRKFKLFGCRVSYSNIRNLVAECLHFCLCGFWRLSEYHLMVRQQLYCRAKELVN